MGAQNIHQMDQEKVQDYYDRFMVLIKCLQSDLEEGFCIINFCVGLLGFIKITTSIVPIRTLTKLMDTAIRCEENCTNANGNQRRWKFEEGKTGAMEVLEATSPPPPIT